MLVAQTERLKFLVDFRPGLLSPTLAAQMAPTYQWQSQGRLLLNVVTGGEPHEQRAYGDFLDREARYARCGEFLVPPLYFGGSPPSTATSTSPGANRSARSPRSSPGSAGSRRSATATCGTASGCT